MVLWQVLLKLGASIEQHGFPRQIGRLPKRLDVGRLGLGLGMLAIVVLDGKRLSHQVT